MNTIKSYLTPNLWMILQRWINLTMRVHIQNVSQKMMPFIGTEKCETINENIVLLRDIVIV